MEDTSGSSKQALVSIVSNCLAMASAKRDAEEMASDMEVHEEEENLGEHYFHSFTFFSKFPTAEIA